MMTDEEMAKVHEHMIEIFQQKTPSCDDALNILIELVVDLVAYCCMDENHPTFPDDILNSIINKLVSDYPNWRTHHIEIQKKTSSMN